MKTLLSLKNISKSYPNTTGASHGFRGMVNALMKKKQSDHINVLNDISFDVLKGQSLAIIGKNGAGKSTLLKILSKVIQPTSGQLLVNARLGALLELGAGFDPEYSGVDNLKLAVELAGIPKSEQSEKIEKMMAFADIGEHVHQPVKTYSSGMVVRLGFAVITETRPDLLITDEVLAVGDENFQLKCLEWLKGYLADGGTLLLVSHSMYHVQSICQKALWIEDGRIRQYGDAYEVSHAYQAEVHDQLKEKKQTHLQAWTYHVQSVQFDQETYQMGQDINITVEVFTPDERLPGLSMGIVSGNNLPVYGTFAEADHVSQKVIEDQKLIYRITIPNALFLPGQYRFKFHAMTPDLLQTIDVVEHDITIKGKTKELGVCRMHVEWH